MNMTSLSTEQTSFLQLMAAHEANDERAIGRISGYLRSLDRPISVIVEEDVTWLESVNDDTWEFPLVTQTFKVLQGNKVVYEGERQFGSEFEDPTHTGLGGRWVTIRVDNFEHSAAVKALESCGLEIDWPSAPPARRMGDPPIEGDEE